MRRIQQDSDDNGFAQWGGYMAAKKSKLIQQFNEAVDNEEAKKINIFKGISVFVNGYTKPSSEEIKHIMTLYGGIYHHYYISGENGTTFIIASNLPDSKVKQLTKNIKILKPSWITDSVKAEKLLNYKDYLLYIDESKSQPRLDFSKSTNLKLNIVEEKNDLLTDKASITKNVKYSHTAVDPNFLTEFYNNSRLHLISTLGVTFKQHINSLRNKSNWKFPAREKLIFFIKNNKQFNNIPTNKIIMHIDMDCFFVSVGLRTRPELVGKPVAVTHGRENQNNKRFKKLERIDLMGDEMKLLNTTSNQEKNDVDSILDLKEFDSNNSMSEIASCSYEARKAGVRNGMFLGTALKLCPSLKTMPYDFDAYKEVAYVLYDTIALYTLEIEAVSCDEMFVDVTDLLHETNASVDQWASFIRTEIKEQTKCPCSTGFGSNRLQARLATKKAKPDGQYYLKHENVETFMLDIEVDELPGIGRSLSNKLTSLGLKTCADLQCKSLIFLQNEIGNKVGESLYSHCRGIDNRPLNFHHIRKSVSAEVNYGIRFKTNIEVETFLKQLCTEVHSRLLEINMKGKNIALKLMIKAKDVSFETPKFMGHGVCDNVTKSSSLLNSTSDLEVIKKEVIGIMRKLSFNPIELRGIGIQISKLEKNNIMKKDNVLTKFLQKSFHEQKKSECIQTIQYDSHLKNDNFSSNYVFNDTMQSCANNFKNILNNKQNFNIELHSSDKIAEVGREVNDTAINIMEKKIEIDKINNYKNKTKKSRGRPKKTIKICKSLTTYMKNNKNCRNDLQKQTVLNIDQLVFKSLPKDIQLEIVNDHNRNNLEHEKTEEQLMNNYEMSSVNEIITMNKDKINKNVLYELPDDIRQEVIEEYSLNVNTMSNENNKCNTMHFLPINEELKVNDSTYQTYKSNSNIDGEILKNMNWTEIKSLFKEWTNSEINPEICDIEMIAYYTHYLAMARNIEQLHKIVKFLYRTLSQNKNCDWHRAYKTIINKFQEGMLATYKSKLQVPGKILCLNC